MYPLTASDLRAALHAIREIGEGCDTPGGFARRGVASLSQLLGSELTTLSVCDLVPAQALRQTPLYEDYYRPIRIRHTMALPIYVDQRLLVSFVFNRAGAAFGDREVQLAETVRPHLTNLYRLGRAAAKGVDAPLTAREREVLEWVAAGKTNRDIAAILGAGPRTIEKHLERVYEKLGVETRTAAVRRAHLA
jgi:DNA-binding CsgD family transcriptional regulator